MPGGNISNLPNESAKRTIERRKPYYFSAHKTANLNRHDRLSSPNVGGCIGKPKS
jgi:hypothetical protein